MGFEALSVAVDLRNGVPAVLGWNGFEQSLFNHLCQRPFVREAFQQGGYVDIDTSLELFNQTNGIADSSVASGQNGEFVHLDVLNGVHQG